jgi:hypothetical protein
MRKKECSGMDSTKLKGRLEVITNIAVCLAAVAVLLVMAGRYLKETGTSIHSGLRTGGVLPSLPGVDYGKSSRTLLIAVSARCDGCGDSVPFFNQLKRSVISKGNSTQIVALFPETGDEVNRFVQQQNLNLEFVSGVNFKDFTFIGTPTMVLVNGNGQIIDFWIGKPSSDLQQEIINSLSVS